MTDHHRLAVLAAAALLTTGALSAAASPRQTQAPAKPARAAGGAPASSGSNVSIGAYSPTGQSGGTNSIGNVTNNTNSKNTTTNNTTTTDSNNTNSNNTTTTTTNNYYGVAPPAPTQPGQPAAARPAGTIHVQFGPASYNSGAFAVVLEPCVQVGEALDCNVRVTPASAKGPLWWFDRNSTVQDEDGVKTVPTWVSLEGKTYNLANGGKGVPLAEGVSTLVKYHFDNIKDATKLQAFSLTFCCTRSVPFKRQN